MMESGSPMSAVSPFSGRQPYEPLCVSTQNGHTRAVLKIQEGCNNHCSYCIIPSVRGPIRSRQISDIVNEVIRLRDAGFCEIVLTGIHLCSYGKDLEQTPSLLDVIRQIQKIEGILRIRLGSLEPVVATESFASALKENDKICPQFHLALQSGSDSVLARMKRRYNTEQYEQGVQNLRRVFPKAAFTTDILTGFPGETEEEFRQTTDFVRKIGFARIHVFPFSPRPDTPAASMGGQLSSAVREQRTRQLIRLGRWMTEEYEKTWIGEETVLLPEEQADGCWEGYTPEYIRVRMVPDSECRPGTPVRIRLNRVENCVMRGEIIKERK
jgi:threonylcarbamoyladenosine tRNA methylthiotransferase MtaB